MTRNITAFVLALLVALSLSACSKRDGASLPSEENPPSPSSSEPSSVSTPPPELSIPAPEPSEPEPSEEDDEPSEPDENPDGETSEAPSAAPSQLPLTATGTVTVDVVDATGSALNLPQNLSLPLPSSWSMDATIIMVNGGKVGEVEPCRKIENPDDPFAALNLPAGYGVFEAGGSSAVTWAEDINMWDAGAGKGATITVRHYYKAKGDFIYGMYFYLAYDGTKTISEATAANVFSGLGPA